MSNEQKQLPPNPFYLEMPIFVAIKTGDYYRTQDLPCPQNENPENYYLVSTSYARHAENLDASRIGGSTTSLRTPGYKHIQSTPMRDSDKRHDVEVDHSYALSHLSGDQACAYHLNGQARVIFVYSVTELADMLRRVSQNEKDHPCRKLSDLSKRPTGGRYPGNTAKTPES